MKKVSDITYLILISIIIIFMMSFFLFEKKVEFSIEENRYLVKFSIKNLENYLEDHFPFRTSLISLKNHFELKMGKTLINDVYIGKDEYLIPIFKDNDKKNYIIKKVNDFCNNNQNVDVIIVPDSIQINEDKLKYHLPVLEQYEINYLYQNISCQNIDVINELKKANEKYELYYKTDHHWTTYGAYVTYREYFKLKGKEYIDIDNFDISIVSDDFLGTSSSLAQGLGKKENISIFDYGDNNLTVEYVYENKKVNSIYNFSYLNVKDKYAMFLDNNHALIKITNHSINDNSSILLIKNSYANAFVPFMVNHYKKVHVIDLRYYTGSVSDYINENSIEDTLILYNLNNMYSDLSIIKLK